MSWDLVADFGADPTGVADSTTNLQTAWNTIGADTFGGALNIPKGAYTITAQTSYSSSKPLWIKGEGQQASQFRLNSTSTSLGYICIAQGASFGDLSGNKGTVRISDVGFYNDVVPVALSNVNRAVYMSGVDHGEVSNVGFYKGSTGHQNNQAVVMNGCNQVRISNCDIGGAVNPVAYMGYCQVCTVEDSHLWSGSVASAGVNTGAAVLYSGQTLGASLRHVICHDGDRGVLAMQDGGGQQPHLLECYDVETNNHTVTHFDIQVGVHFTLLGGILSGAAVSTNVPGVVFGPSYQGEATIADTQFIGVPGHSMIIKAGSGYVVDSCKFGGGGSYKAANNTYDELNISSGATNVTVTSNHFNTDANMGVGTSMVPRYGLNSASPSLTTASNIYASAGLYGTGQHNP